MEVQITDPARDRRIKAERELVQMHRERQRLEVLLSIASKQGDHAAVLILQGRLGLA